MNSTEPDAMKSTDKVSAIGTEFDARLEPLNMLPRGSALITGSGDLAGQGIESVLHAATGAMTKSGSVFEPTGQSVRNSIINSLTLAQRRGFAKIAIPFIGGNIFLTRIGISADDLADEIVRAACEHREDVALAFVVFRAEESEPFERSLQRLDNHSGAAQVVVGNILDKHLHGAPCIINAANMEVTFGGGLSGAIARATGDRQSIDDEAHAAIQEFWRAQ